MTAEGAKSRRGGRRPGAGRKPKGHVPPAKVAGLDLTSALEAPAPGEIESVAQRHARSAIAALSKLLIHGASEAARINAANTILDRGYGKPSVEAGGDPMLPFFGPAPDKPVPATVEIREEARKYANLAIEVLHKIADGGQSESARATAAKSLLDRGLGTVAPAKLPDSFGNRPLGKKEEAQHAARNAATGRYATPTPPRAIADTMQ